MVKLEVTQLQARLHEFADARDWQQFHTPKNLASAAAVEASELLEIFQWLTPGQSASLTAAQMKDVAEEIADVLIYLLRLADVLGIELDRAVDEKMAENESKYPVDESRGTATKYDRR